MIALAIVLTILFVCGPAVAEEPQAPAGDPPASPAAPPTPASPSPAPASPDPTTNPAPAPTPPAAPATPPTPAASVRPDFAAIKQAFVIVRDGPDTDAGQAPGFGVSDLGHIVTSADSLRDQPSYLVSNAEGQVFSANRLTSDDKTGLMILRLPGGGHGVTGLTFATTALRAAAPLHAVTFNPRGPERFVLVPGTVTRMLVEDGAQLITHNALFSRESAGTPLLNRCYEAVGVNVLEKQGLLRREADPTEQGSARSLAAASLSRLLASVGLPLPLAETACLSLEEETRQAEQVRQEQEARRQQERAAAEREAQEQAAALQQEKEAAERRARERAAALQQERTAAEQLAQEKEAAEQLAEEKTAAEREAQGRAATLQRERTAAEQLAKESEQREHQTLLYASIVGGVLLLGIVTALWSRHRRLRTAEEEKQNLSGSVDRMQSELSEAAARDRLRSNAPDVFIEGVRLPIALKIPGASLVEPGAVVGRSPAESTFVINHEQVSRRHFRLVLISGQLTIEDLGSTNGTSVNGRPLEQGRPQPLDDASRVRLGDLELTFHTGT